jgi:hypothetical protein
VIADRLISKPPARAVRDRVEPARRMPFEHCAALIRQVPADGAEQGSRVRLVDQVAGQQHRIEPAT